MMTSSPPAPLNANDQSSPTRSPRPVSTTKVTYDAQTWLYVTNRRAEGRNDREIRRCIKHYLARHVYRTLNATTPSVNGS